MERSNVPRNFNYIQTKLWNTRISTPLYCTVQLKYVLSFDSFLNDGAQAYNMLRPVTYSVECNHLCDDFSYNQNAIKMHEFLDYGLLCLIPF